MKTIWRNPYYFDKNYPYEKIMNSIKMAGDLGPVSLLDHTNTIKRNDRVSMFPDIVEYFKNPYLSSKDFDETIEAVVRRAIDYGLSLNKKIYVWYSGGIDSTALVIAVIKVTTPDERKNIVIKANAESIREYPAFYPKLQELFSIEDSSDFSTYFDDVVNIDGAYGDTLFGSSVITSLLEKNILPYDYSTEPLEKVNDLVYRVVQDIDVADWFVEQTMPIVKRFNGKTVYDFFWIQGLTMNYQDLNLIPFIRIANARKHSTEQLANIFQQNLPARIFGTPDFISYSLKYGQQRNSYGRPRECSLKYILDYTHDSDYYNNKVKEFSQGKIYQKSVVSRIYENFTFEPLTVYRL